VYVTRLARRSESVVIEHGEILLDGPAGLVRVKSFISGRSLAAVRIGLNETGVDREGFAAHQPFGHAEMQKQVEDVTEEIAVAKAAVPVLREGRVVGHSAFQA
jgi:hypothetical protein